VGKKLKRDFKERQTIKEEAKILEKENVSTNESSRLKHGDDYRGKIIHDKDRFQDKIHEKTSKINVENDHIQGVFKRNARYTKGAYENQNTAINDKSRYEAHDDFMSSKDSKGFKEVNNHSSSCSDRPDYLFHILSGEYKRGEEGAYREYQSALRKFNNHLKSLSRKLRLHSSVTSYTLRHSWATTAKYRGVPIEMISESLGHKSIKTTQIYLKGFELEERTKVNKQNYYYVRRFKIA